MTNETARFYNGIAPFDDFTRITDLSVYRPLPEDWWIGLTDVASSTEAIEAGRYKQVNMAGAAAISAVMNALGSRDFPFVFGGDGTSFAVSSEEKDLAATALARTATWARQELDLDLRAAMVPLADVRAAGHNVRVGRFAVSDHVSYAMFSGHGLEWAESAMKASNYAITPAPPEDRPDLTGLSCRWQPMPAQRGCILSILIAPGRDVDETAFAGIVAEILAMTDGGDFHGSPLTREGPQFTLPPAGVELELRTAMDGGSRLKRRIVIWLQSLLAVLLDRTGISLGGFDPKAYRADLAGNSDFRKFDDALRMTIDCEPAMVERIESRLAQAAEAGLVRYGLHSQDEALMTCIVPSVVTRDHMHFLDGAGGGYARAAAAMKAMG